MCIAVGLLATLGVAKSFQDAKSNTPLVVFFSSPTVKIDYSVAYKSLVPTSKVGEMTEIKNGDCLVRLGSNLYAYFSKSVPSIREVRARQFFYGLVEKNGLQIPIGFSEIQKSEFADVLEPFWWQYAEFGPTQRSKFSINLSLETTVRAGSDVKVVNFGPHQTDSESASAELKGNPIVAKRTKQEAQKYRAEHSFSYSGNPYTVWENQKISHEVEFGLVKDANELLRSFLREKLNALEADFDRFLSTDPKFSDTVARRSARSMDDLAKVAPSAFQTMLSILGQSPGVVGGTSDNVRSELGNGQLTHRYDVHLMCFDDQGRELMFSLTNL
ncbi:MAG: hypothetical protein GC165_01950 [Armatimonadetes bacterium]|nr:hypothetical protein [Armatimonadota bacterium]MBS1726954.1 hypothetical protein [Armatimonadota bacterium]